MASPGQVRKGVGKVTALCGLSGAGEEGGRQNDRSVWPVRGQVRKGVGKVTALCGLSGAGEEGGRQSDSSVWPVRGR